MTQLLEYALIENDQIIRTEWFKRPSLVPAGDWRVVGEVVPSFDASTHQLGEKMLGILEGGAVAYMWSVVPLPPPQVPVEIQMWQARAILFRSGLLGQVEQAVKAATNPEIEIAWEYAPSVVRQSAFVLAMAMAINLDNATIDNLFIEGAKIR
jgi:hypothetical protein